MDKSTLRSFYKEKRAKISDKNEKSLEISEKILKTDIYKNSKVIMLFYPKENEVNTLHIMDKALSDGKTVVFPVTDKENKALIPTIYNGSFKKGAFGIYEPLGEEISKNEIDFAIVPALSADKEGYRLGYGGGYYDRFLKDFKGKKIVVLFFELMSDELPRDEFDIKADLIITD